VTGPDGHLDGWPVHPDQVTLPLDPPPPRQWRLDLPYRRPPLSLNDRHGHWAARHRAVEQVRADVGWLVRQAKIPRLRRAAVQLHYQPRAAGRRDADNLTATSKPCVDALVSAGVLADDTPAFVDQLMPVIHPPAAAAPEHGSRLWLTIREAR